MFSGKTTELLRRYTFGLASKSQPILVKHAIDTRAEHGNVDIHSGLTTSHRCRIVYAKQLRDCFSLKSVEDSKLILIDEGQFFDDIVESTIEMLYKGKDVVIASLDANWALDPIGRVHKLFPMASTIRKLCAVCSVCQGEAIHSSITVKTKDIIVIGGREIYKAVCHNCYRSINGLN